MARCPGPSPHSAFQYLPGGSGPARAPCVDMAGPRWYLEQGPPNNRSGSVQTGGGALGAPERPVSTGPGSCRGLRFERGSPPKTTAPPAPPPLRRHTTSPAHRARRARRTAHLLALHPRWAVPDVTGPPTCPRRRLAARQLPLPPPPPPGPCAAMAPAWALLAALLLAACRPSHQRAPPGAARLAPARRSPPFPPACPNGAQPLVTGR